MSISLKNEIFFLQTFFDSEVEFYRVVRSTTNTCEVLKLKKNVVFQNEDFQYVEPQEDVMKEKHRCRVISYDVIEFKSGKLAQLWDGKPVKQSVIIYLPVF